MNVEEQRQQVLFVSLSCEDFRDLVRGKVVVKELPSKHGLGAVRIQILLQDIVFGAK